MKNEIEIKTRPKREVLKNSVFAFLVGGGICMLGEIIRLVLLEFGVNTKESFEFSQIIMILIGTILTGIGVYDKISQYAGCGTICPVTGFSNTMTSCSLDGRSEGVFLGILPNMFKISGCVIIVGIVTGFIICLLRYIVGLV